MYCKTFILPGIFVCVSCVSQSPSHPLSAKQFTLAATVKPIIMVNPYRCIHEIPLPAGFKRIPQRDDSFGSWLSAIGLKKDKTVYTYNGAPKQNQSAQFAVLNISVGEKDLQQCADAVIRLRSEYLFAGGKYSAIRFRDNAGTVYQFQAPYTTKNLQLFLQKVFGMCGTASLSKQLKPGSWQQLQPGDVIIKGGFPGHAVIIMDVAVNEAGKNIFLLAQSYMPAQDIHVLINPSNKELSPWYEVPGEALLQTPEYTFTKNQLMSW